MGKKNARAKRKCAKKIAFEKEAQAIASALSLRSAKADKSIGAYKCRYCNKWHVGHRPLRIQVRIKTKAKERE